MYPIKRLREIMNCCFQGQNIDPDLAAWLASSLNDFLSKRVGSVDEALGLRLGRGGVPWWREEAIRIRDEALRNLRERFFPDHSINSAAKEIANMSRRYAATAWRFERELKAFSANEANTAREWLWLAFSSGATMPLGERQLRNILQ